MISFNEVPANTRTPFTFIEFDNSNANQGPAAQTFRMLMLGQKLSGGTAAAKVPVRVTSESQAIELFGQSSMLHLMAKKSLLNNSSTELIVYPLEDDVNGTKASGSIAFSGTATATGVLYFYIAGQRVTLAIKKDDAASAIGDKLVSSIGDVQDLPVTASNTTGTVSITFKHNGVVGNTVDIRQGYYQDEKSNVAGVSVSITDLSSGTVNPDLSTDLANLPDEMYNVIINPYTDSANLATLVSETADRWGADKQLDGMVITAATGTQSELGTLGDSQNSQHLCIMDAHSSPTPVFEWAAAFGAVVAFEMQNDQARPMQSVQIEGVLAEEISDHFTREERNLLLYDGISTHYVDASGIPRIERCITTYKTSPLGAVDTSYLDVNTLFTLSYIRFDLRTHILNIFPRHKLAKDGTLVQPGQPIVRPSDAKEEAIIKARQWESKGLIESADNFKDGLITEINSSDPNRLDWVMSPDLMNQLRVNAIKIGFKL